MFDQVDALNRSGMQALVIPEGDRYRQYSLNIKNIDGLISNPLIVPPHSGIVHKVARMHRRGHCKDGTPRDQLQLSRREEAVKGCNRLRRATAGVH
jgi:hypothetical protein